MLRQHSRHFPDDIFKWSFFNENAWTLIKISLKFVPRYPVNNIPALIQIMAWHPPGDKLVSEPMMVSLLMNIYMRQSASMSWPKLTHLSLVPAAYMSQWIDQSHRYGRHQAACREPAGSYDKTTRTAICFEHNETQYLLIRTPYTRIVVFWHISNIPPMISQSQISCNTPTFYIAAIFVKHCYTTGSWLL